jgi:hypothetical protein
MKNKHRPYYMSYAAIKNAFQSRSVRAAPQRSDVIATWIKPACVASFVTALPARGQTTRRSS